MTSMPTVPSRQLAASREGLTDRVYDAIVDFLLMGSLPVDTPIRIDQLARMLGVSATPVREALVRLESTGLVIRENFKGYRTGALLSAEELQDLMAVRLLLEPEAAFQACQKHNDTVLPALQAAWEEQQSTHASVGADGFLSFMRADQQFHRTINEGSGNRFLAVACSSVGGNVQRWRQFEDGVILDAADSLAEHKVILEAFRSGVPEAARAAMVSHLERLSARMAHETQQ
ncbi:MAG: GntR family transcriptional regulator [Arachnia sp.]